MDPLSLTTGILALISACNTVATTFNKIRRLNEAPGIIQAMNNEISDLQLLLVDMRIYMERVQSRASTLPKVDEAVFRLCASTLGLIRDKVLEVDSLITSRLIKEDQEAGTRVHRGAFVRHRDKIIKFQAELREYRHRVADIARILEVRQLSRLEDVLDDIRLQDLSILIQGQKRMERQLSRLTNRQAISDASLVDLGERVVAPSNECSSVCISLSRLRPAKRHIRCTCFRQGDPSHLQAFLGTLFLGYGVAPTLSSNRQSCSHHYQTEIRVAYYFPVWFLKFVLWLQMQFRMAGLSRSSLPSVQVLPPEHVALDLIKFGDIDGIKRLLSSGQLSIKAQLPNGANLLHVSFRAVDYRSNQS